MHRAPRFLASARPPVDLPSATCLTAFSQTAPSVSILKIRVTVACHKDSLWKTPRASGEATHGERKRDASSDVEEQRFSAASSALGETGL
jgi:hypothetical protein